MRQSEAREPRTQCEPITQNTTVVDFPGKPKRQYLTPAEVETLVKSAEKRGRYGKRDGLMVYMAARHGFRRSELVDLRWHQLDLKGATLHVQRLKGSKPSLHYLDARELRGLGRIAKGQGPGCEFVFVTERGGPMTGDGFDKMLRRAAAEIGMAGVHSHLLRHACGFKLVNEGRDTRSIQGYLGHSQIRHTERYTALDANRFRGW
jgi:type 1 fimbriae regulatory protein FimB/type 1 fimbriae regulatory protein FimE